MAYGWDSEDAARDAMLAAELVNRGWTSADIGQTLAPHGAR